MEWLDVSTENCPVQSTLDLVGEKWTLLILREASFFEATRFGEFRANLGIASDVLTERLATLVDHGVMEKVPYQEPGSRPRDSYVLTDAGRELSPILGALQQWGDRNLPWPAGPTVIRRLGDSDREAHVAFVDERGREVEIDAVKMVRTDP